MIRMLTVTDSSQIAAIGYDPDRRELKVRFISGGLSGASYLYADVSSDEFVSIVTADSIGGAFDRLIKKANKACVKL